jgi:peptidoglycan hydrolase-like protein with peptidoglycan-binding domain
LAELIQMRAYTISKVRFATILLAALSFASLSFAAPQAGGKTTTSRKSVIRRPVRKRKARQRAQAAPTPARISQIQAALAAQGVYKGQPNGKWDGATIQAMKDYQSAHALTATGKLDALTLQKLGLGSEIAGRAAPLPLPQSPSAPPPGEPQQTP